MSAIRGTYKDGKIILDGPPPADWPDGARVSIYVAAIADETLAPDPTWSDRPDTIAVWIAAYDAVSAGGPAETNQAKWAAARRARRVFDFASQVEHGDSLRKLFD